MHYLKENHRKSWEGLFPEYQRNVGPVAKCLVPYPWTPMRSGNKVKTERTNIMKKLIYGICFALLLSSNVLAEDISAVQVDVLAKTGLSWDGRDLPEYPKGTPEITILRIKIPPGAQLPLHKHPVINAGVLLNGELTVVTEDNRTLHLKTGEAIVEVVNKWHYGKNESNKTAEIIVFYAGVRDTPITITDAPIIDTPKK
jgi:quercetin dioxygenase-like cupin family protein